MARALGQVDERKGEAILDAARDVFAEKGPAATMEEIARRAGVSKQTLYNRFGSKLEIGRALAARRSEAVTAPHVTHWAPRSPTQRPNSPATAAAPSGNKTMKP